MIDNLTSVILKNAKRGQIRKSKKESFLYFLSFLIVFAFLLGVMTSFSIYITRKLKVIHQEYAFCNLLLLMNYFILFTKSIFESINVLYFSKDLRIFLRMPVKIKKLLNAKFINMIVSEYEMESIMLAVPMITYGIIMHVGMMFYVYMFIILLILPIIPIMVTSLVISIVMRFTNAFKNKNKTMYITIILVSFIMLLIVGGFSNNNLDFSAESFSNMVFQVNGISEKISDYFVLIKPIMNSLLYYSDRSATIDIVSIIIESIFAYVIILEIISKIYLKGAIGTTINSNSRKREKDKKILKKDFKTKTLKNAYLIKELKTIIRSPIFCIQCIITPIINPLFMFAILMGLIKFAESVGLNLWIMLGDVANSSYGIAIFLLCGQVFYMMNFASIIAISKDEANAKLIKVLPIDLKKQLYIKMKIGTILNFIPILLLSCFYFMCSKNILLTIMMILVLTFINLIGEKFKINIDLNKPQMSWDSEYSMMKQNTNVMYELFYTLVFAGILILISFIIKNTYIYIVLISFILLVLNIMYKIYFSKNINKLFSKIY